MDKEYFASNLDSVHYFPHLTNDGHLQPTI
jgi:hypothetical protein